MLARFTQATVRLLDHLAGHIVAADDSPVHQQTRRRGEIDLIGWDQNVLCFIEVKPRTSRRVKPAEAAVDLAKQRELWLVAREYLRHLAPDVSWRFDVVSVYYENPASSLGIELFKNAFVVA
jgi:putative endonuclease